MRNIPNYSKYSISPCGTIVLNNETGTYLKIGDQQIKGANTGYKYVTLSIDYNYKRIAVHRLVAFTYLEPPTVDQLWVNHKDGDKSNNNYTNLEWTSIKENIQHAFDTKLRVMPKGVDHWHYGNKASNITKRKQSEAKTGKNHPKFKGYYIVHHLKYESAPIAAAAWSENARTILRKCKSGKVGSEYYFVSTVDKAD